MKSFIYSIKTVFEITLILLPLIKNSYICFEKCFEIKNITDLKIVVRDIKLLLLKCALGSTVVFRVSSTYRFVESCVKRLCFRKLKK